MQLNSLKELKVNEDEENFRRAYPNVKKIVSEECAAVVNFKECAFHVNEVILFYFL